MRRRLQHLPRPIAREAQAAGVSRQVVDQAFAGLAPDPAVLAFDRRQRGTFRKTFEEYARTRVIPARVNRARGLMARHGALLDRIERQFGVPKEVIMAIWTLENAGLPPQIEILSKKQFKRCLTIYCCRLNPMLICIERQQLRRILREV